MPDAPIDRLTTQLGDRYRVERELGSGGMATVYLAEDLRHGRKVALKVLKPELSAVIGAARFLAEIKTTANLHHPHILSLHDSGEIDGTVYYVMPFVDGESLRDRLAREKQLPIADAIRISTEVADALQYAHTHGVIHRDIKPDNILLHDGHAVVADFGIALAARSVDSRMTETGMSLGTPHYMSPEQAMGERDLDSRTDVYALGCVLYEMLTGQPPFTGPTAQSIVAKVITERAAPPSALRSTVSEPLDEAVLTALEKLPADRFESAAKFASAIAESAAATRGARAHQRAAAARPRTRRTVAMAVALLAVSVLAAAGWMKARGVGVSAGPAVYDAALPDSAPLSFAGPLGQLGYGLATTNVSISADGAFAVYPAVRGESSILWSRSLRDTRASPIAGTEGGATAQISPDGSRVAFVAAGRVMVVPIAGGTPKQLLVVGAPVTLQWLSARQLIAVHSDGLRLTWLDPETGPTREARINRCNIGR
ncbi:MAG: protein kinase domain-containing protein [Gemmatimonadaceae bacterium]